MTSLSLLRRCFCFISFLTLPSLCYFTPPVHANDECPDIPSPPDKIAAAFGYAIYSDQVSGNIIEGGRVCLDENGNVVDPVVSSSGKLCSLDEVGTTPNLTFDPESGSLVANVSNLGFATTHSDASLTFDVTTLESPSGSSFLISSGDFSSSGSSPLVLSSGIPLLVARANDGYIPFKVEFTNGHLQGAYRAVVVVTCAF